MFSRACSGRRSTIQFDSGRRSSRYGFNAAREGLAVPEMLNGQCILLQLMHEGSNGEEDREKRLHDVNATQFALI